MEKNVLNFPGAEDRLPAASAGAVWLATLTILGNAAVKLAQIGGAVTVFLLAGVGAVKVFGL